MRETAPALLLVSGSSFAHENGRLLLATALFDRYKYRIRCPSCRGNPSSPGFIKDSAGKKDQAGLPRRQWTCQRSNSRATAAFDRCARQSCKQFIDLALGQLLQEEVRTILRAICQEYPPEREENSALQAY